MWASTLLALSLSQPAQDLASLAAGDDRFEVLMAAVQEVGLLDALANKGPWTVLAPTDDAFRALPEGLLEQLVLPRNRDSLVSLLGHHLIEGSRSAGELLAAGEARTVAGTTLRFSLRHGRFFAGDAPVAQNDVSASNGTLHVIDRVLVPDDFQLTPEHPAIQLLEAAIERGTPLFNAGQTAACAAVYEVTVNSLLLLESDPALSAEQMQVLARAMEQAAGQQSGAERAWTLRRAMDLVWTSLLNAAPVGELAVDQTDTPAENLFNFDGPEFSGDSQWFAVNDNVMGGISRGGLQGTGASVGVFTGALSLANNGGFSTVRSPARDLNLGGTTGLEMRIRGDGRTYSVRALRSDRRGEIRTWKASFETRAGVWQTVRVPFADMKLSVMGRQFAETADPAEVRSLGFSISDKNESPFRLEIDWIRAYTEEGIASE